MILSSYINFIVKLHIYNTICEFYCMLIRNINSNYKTDERRFRLYILIINYFIKK